MAFTRAWRNFRRMQDVAVAAASLIYAGAVVNAFQVLPGGQALIVQRFLRGMSKPFIGGEAHAERQLLRELLRKHGLPKEWRLPGQLQRPTANERSGPSFLP